MRRKYISVACFLLSVSLSASVLVTTPLSGADQQAIVTKVDLSHVTPIRNRLQPKQRQQLVTTVAGFLKGQYPLWDFAAVGEEELDRDKEPRLSLVLHSEGGGDITNRSVDMDVILAFADGSSRIVNQGRVSLYKPGQLKRIWRMPRDQMATQLGNGINGRLRELHERLSEQICKVQVANGILRVPRNDRAELPIPWEPCCRLATSVFELRCPTQEQHVAIVSAGTGVESDRGNVIVLHTHFRDPPGAALQPIDKCQRDLAQLVGKCTRVLVVSFDEKGACPQDERLSIADN